MEKRTCLYHEYDLWRTAVTGCIIDTVVLFVVFDLCPLHTQFCYSGVRLRVLCYATDWCCFVAVVYAMVVVDFAGGRKLYVLRCVEVCFRVSEGANKLSWSFVALVYSLSAFKAHF